MVPASAVQTGDIMANTEDIKNISEDMREDNKEISQSSNNMESHTKTIQDTINEMDKVKWYQFWKWDFYLRQGPNKIKNEGIIVESLSKDTNNKASDVEKTGNQVADNGEKGIETAIDVENQKSVLDIGNDSYNTGDAKVNAQLIAESLSSHFNNKYVVTAPNNLVKGDIVQHYLDHNNYVYLQYVGMNPAKDTALYIGDKNTAVRLPANDQKINYKITPQSQTPNIVNPITSNDSSVTNALNQTNMDNAVTSPEISYIDAIQEAGLKNYNDSKVKDYTNEINKQKTKKDTGTSLLISGGSILGAGFILAVIANSVLAVTAVLSIIMGLLSIFMGVGGLLSAAVAGFIACHGMLMTISGALDMIGIGLLIAGGVIFDKANKQITKLNGDKKTFTDGSNVIGTDLDTYNNGKKDILPVSTDSAFDTEENGNMTCTLNATDADGDGIIYMMERQASQGTVSINNNGTYTYASNKNFTGNDSFTYKSNDIYGNSNIATVNVTVHPTNHAPVSNNLTFDIETNNNLTAELNVTDTDGDPVTYEILNSTSQGNITLNSNGTFNYVPADGFIGNDTFTYTAKDWKETGNNATVQIHIHPVNHEPVTNNANFTMNKNENIKSNLTATDEDGDLLSYNIKDKPSHGKLILNSDGSFDYTPNKNYTGNETFTYTAKDWKDTSEIGTVKIEVQDVNHVPLVPNMNLTTTINKALKGQFKAMDLDDDKQTFKIVKTTSHGTLNTNGTQFTYTPTKNFNGTDSFNYQSNDGKTDSNIAKITIIVTKTAIKVINTPITMSTPTKTVKNTVNIPNQPEDTPKNTLTQQMYAPKNTLTQPKQVKTLSLPKNNTLNQTNMNISIPAMLTSLQDTLSQFVMTTIQQASNFKTSILKI